MLPSGAELNRAGSSSKPNLSLVLGKLEAVRWHGDARGSIPSRETCTHVKFS